MEEKSLFDQPSDAYLDIITFGKPYVDLNDGREGYIHNGIAYMEPKKPDQSSCDPIIYPRCSIDGKIYIEKIIENNEQSLKYGLPIGHIYVIEESSDQP